MALYLFVLSQENLPIAGHELRSLLKPEECFTQGHIMIADPSDTKNISRLAYTKRACRILFHCEVSMLQDALLLYDWKGVYKKNFSLRSHDEGYDAKDYAKYIWRALVARNIKPHVNLNDPSTPIEIFIIGNSAIVTLLIWENHERFEERKAHNRPEIYPTAMHPKLARSIVNMVDSKEIIDPFCGAGGIIIEAALMGVKSGGYDIDQKVLDSAKKTLKSYRIKPSLYRLEKKDSTRIKSLKNVATDLPYGRSSKKSHELSTLYARFVRSIAGRSVVVFPDFVDYKSILKKNLRKGLSFKVFDYYVHATLTRKIVVIRDARKSLRE